MNEQSVMVLLGSFAGLGGIPLVRWLANHFKVWLRLQGGVTAVALILGVLWNLLLSWAGVLVLDVPSAIALGIIVGAGASGYNDWKTRGTTIR